MAASAHPERTFAGRVDEAADEERPVILVGESARFEGLVTFRGSARVDGEVEGEIVCRGTLRLGETARVRGVIEVDELIVAGNLEGEATARQRIELTATARVRASLRTPRLALAEGCVMQGRCETGMPPEDS